MQLSYNGNRLTLKIDNYQFLHADNTHDLNWVMVWVCVQTLEGRWSFRAPFMTTADLPRWARWFGDPTASGLDTLTGYEGVVFIEYHGFKDGLVHLTIEFTHEALPPWAKVSGEREYRVDFNVSAEQMQLAAESFRQYTESFPPR